MAEKLTVEVVAGQAGRPVEGKEWKDLTPKTWWQKLRQASLNNRWRVAILWLLTPIYIMCANIYLVHYWSSIYVGNPFWKEWCGRWYKPYYILRALFTDGWEMWLKLLNANIRARIPEVIYSNCYRNMALGFFVFAIIVKFFSFSRVDKERANAVMQTKGTSHWANEEEIKQMGLLDNSNGAIIGGYKKNGHIHYLRHSGTEHIICVAPSRSGKGVGLVIPTLLDWNESVIVLDLKGENYIATSGYRRNVMHQHTMRFEPTWTPEKPVAAMYEGDKPINGEADMLSTAHYNPLEEIRMGTPDEVRDIQNVAELLIQSDGGGGGKDPFWDNSAIALLTGAIAYELYRKRQENEDPNPNIGNVRVAMQSGDMKELFDKWKNPDYYDDIFAVRYSDYFYTFKDIEPRFKVLKQELHEADKKVKEARNSHSPEELATNDEIKKEIAELDEKVNQKKQELEQELKKLKVNKLAFEKANQMLANADDTLSSIVATVNSKLKVWDDPAISANTSHATFHIKDLVNSDKPVSFYLTIYPNDIDRLRPLMRILLSQVCATLAGKMQREADGRIGSGYKHQLLLMLDEFPQLKKMDFLQSGFAYFSGYGIRAYIICQDLEQLEDVYGKNETITSNCHVQIYYAPNKDATARKISEKCGKTTLVIKSSSSSGNPFSFFRTGESVSYHNDTTDLLNPTQVMNDVHKTANGVAGDSIIFITGHNPIFATQTPYYLDKIIYPRSQKDYPKDNSVTAVERKKLPLTKEEERKKIELFSSPDSEELKKMEREQKEEKIKAEQEAKRQEYLAEIADDDAAMQDLSPLDLANTSPLPPDLQEDTTEQYDENGLVIVPDDISTDEEVEEETEKVEEAKEEFVEGFTESNDVLDKDNDGEQTA